MRQQCWADLQSLCLTLHTLLGEWQVIVAVLVMTVLVMMLLMVLMMMVVVMVVVMMMVA